jgi:hypothetical protein
MGSLWFVRHQKRRCSRSLATAMGLLAFLSCLVAGPARGAEIERMYRSAYHLGMGDTGVAFARGSDAVFYNPAGIALSTPLLVEVSVLSPQIEVARSSENLYREIESGKDPVEVASGAKGQQQFLAVQNYTGVVFNRAAMGIFQRGQLDAYLGNNVLNGLPMAELGSAVFVGAHLSYAKPFAEQFFLGVNVKVVQKARSRLEMDALEAQNLESDSLKSVFDRVVERGAGVGADVGAIYRTDSKTRLSIGAVARNLGMSYHWALEKDAPLPDPEPAVVDIGLSIEPETRKSRSRLAADFRDVFDEMGESSFKRLHLGAELSFQDVVGGSIGLNQGYLTYGGFVNVKIVRIEAGVFAEEFGDYPGHRQSKRAYGRVGIGWYE